jgi:hypothetical protein
MERAHCSNRMKNCIRKTSCDKDLQWWVDDIASAAPRADTKWTTDASAPSFQFAQSRGHSVVMKRDQGTINNTPFNPAKPKLV